MEKRKRRRGCLPVAFSGGAPLSVVKHLWSESALSAEGAEAITWERACAVSVS